MCLALAVAEAPGSHPHLHRAVLGAGSKLVARVGEAKVQDLVSVLLERLHLHAGHCVIQPLELLIPGCGRCGRGESLLGPQVFLSTEARTLTVWRSALPLEHTRAQLRDTPCPPNPSVALC